MKLLNKLVLSYPVGTFVFLNVVAIAVVIGAVTLELRVLSLISVLIVLAGLGIVRAVVVGERY